MDPKGGALGITNPCTASSPRGLGRSSSGRREAGGAWQGKGAEGRGQRGSGLRGSSPTRCGPLSLSRLTANRDRPGQALASLPRCSERGWARGRQRCVCPARRRHGPAARPARALLAAAAARSVPGAPVALRDGAAGAAGALEPDVGRYHTAPSPGSSPHLCRLRTCQGRGAAGVQSLSRWGWGLGFAASGAAGAGGACHRSTGSGSGTLGSGSWCLAQGRVGLCPPRALGARGRRSRLCTPQDRCEPSSPPGPADLLQELVGRRLPGHRGGNCPSVLPHGLPSPGTQLSPVTRPSGWHKGSSPDTGGARATWAQLPMDLSVPTVRVGFQLGTALQLRLEGSEEEEDGDSDSALEPGQTVAGQQQRRDASEAVLGRLEALEADVRFLCTELGAEKLLWSSRFLELLREQQSLRQRLQELPWQWNGGDSPEPLGEADDQSASGSEGEGLEGRRWMEPPRPPRGFIQPDRQKT